MVLNLKPRLRAARLAPQPARALHARGAERAHKVIGHVSSPAAPALGGPGASAATGSLSLSAAAEEARSGGKQTFSGSGLVRAKPRAQGTQRSREKGVWYLEGKL
jgi:hypothetical protein